MGFPLSQLQAMVDRVPLSDWLLYGYAQDDGMILTRDNMVGFVMECSPVVGAGDESEKVLRGLFETPLPPRSAIQISLYASDHIEPMLRHYEQLRTPGTIFRETAIARANMYRQAAHGSLIKGATCRPRDFRLFVSVKTPAGSTPKSIREALTALKKTRDSVKQACRSIPTWVELLTHVQLLELVRELVNPGHNLVDDPIHSPGSRPMNKEVVMNDTICRVTDNSVYLDGRTIKSLCPKQYPDTWTLSDMNGLIGDLFQVNQQIMVPFWLTLNVVTLPQDEMRHEIQAKASIISNQAQGPLAKLIPRLLVRRESLDMMLMAFEQGLYSISANLNLILFAKDEAEATMASRSAQSLWRTRNYVLQEDPYITLPMFLQNLPLGLLTDKKMMWEFGRSKTMHTGNASTLCPIISDWGGTGTPTIMLTSRRGQLMLLDLFDNTMGNYNCCVAAASGSGKSFFINDLINGYLGQNAQVWVIDVGRSYLKLCQQLQGQFIEFSTETDLSLNPFTNIRDIADSIDLLKGAISQMAFPTKPVTDIQRTTIEQALMEGWNKFHTDLTITKLAEILNWMRDPVAEEISRCLFPYTAAGSYGRWFEKPANISFDRFTVLELEELKSKKELQSVVLLLLIFQIQQAMYLGDRGTKKVVVIDEAWDLIRGGNTAAFIESGYRRFRKYNGAAITITQGINDLYQAGQAGTAIIDNSDWLFLLRQKPESIQALIEAKRLPISEHMQTYLKSVQTIKGNYSEIYIQSPMGSGIGRLIVDRYSQLIYTTDPKEWAPIEKRMQEGMTLHQAILETIRLEELQATQ